jgi:hypothetical protein
MGGEHFGKEVVIAIPVTPIIQRDDKEVTALQGLQPRLASLLAGDGIAQWTMQAVENSGLEQEVADRAGLPLQDLFDQIVHDISVVAGEGPDELGSILPAPQGKRG